MGLCKCPKRKVTNLFCFEHRVNVCEHCLVANHTKCIIQSYLQWLQDSDYNPNCRLCNTLLSTKETTRLACYDLFHWSCLNELASQLPLNTAPAGYQCPTCQGPIFPPANLVSPVASNLREKLSTVNWARAGLGLPLIEEPVPVEDVSSHDITDYRDWSVVNSSSDELSEIPERTTQTGYLYNSVSPPTTQHGTSQDHTVIIGNTEGDSVSINPGSTARKIYDTRDEAKSQETLIDFDDDKYRRRPTLSWLARILKNRAGSKGRPVSTTQRFFIILIIGVLGFFTLILIMSKLGRASADSDPNLDPLFNPHIRVGQE
ncbi:zinc finger protein-like 1 [Spea bombifrons]|uniref:zinc finger protein-like 1 n=1 Tax=Spea bombifrons TaxID=233779 RepID=UPI002349ABEC|nr:zinc finger protein-like 1 [Spea bombifrons]XP_053305420.1 zinc finger protein-like 1 [Spea bombifrons]XP_053305421.1 zinc finger protein-like 1 [Spea bombifrons]